MKIKPLSELITEDLSKLEEKQKMFFYFQLGAIILLAVISLYLTGKNGVSFFTFMPLLFFPLLSALYLQWKKVNVELRSRKK